MTTIFFPDAWPLWRRAYWAEARFGYRWRWTWDFNIVLL